MGPAPGASTTVEDAAPSKRVYGEARRRGYVPATEPAPPHRSRPGVGAGGCDEATLPAARRRLSARTRRPDRAVYVPRARRTQDTQAPESQPLDTKSISPGRGPEVDCSRPTTVDQKPDISLSDLRPPKDKSAPSTPRRERKYCNILYTPPHLRNTSKRRTISNDIENSVNDVSPPNSDSDNYNNLNTYSVEPVSVFRDNCNLGFYTPNNKLARNDQIYLEDENNTKSQLETNNSDKWIRDKFDSDNMDVNASNVIDDKEQLRRKDEDDEHVELRRASREINRSNRRIIKQSFDTDILVISDPIEAPKQNGDYGSEKHLEMTFKDDTSSEKISVKREESCWDDAFDSEGECLDPSLAEELAASVGRVSIVPCSQDYRPYTNNSGSDEPQELGHVIEAWGFPTSFSSNDLLSVFADYKEPGFTIKWVDDNHALIVFASQQIAEEVLSRQWHVVKVRALADAAALSRAKARRCAQHLQPYKERPATCAALARRLVSGALGLRLPHDTLCRERARETSLILQHKQRVERQAAQRAAAWEGTLASTGGADTAAEPAPASHSD